MRICGTLWPAYVSNRFFFFFNICSFVSTLQRTTVSVTTPHCTVTAQALLDSGSAGKFISEILLQHQEIPMYKRLKYSLHPGKIAGQRVDNSLYTCHLAYNPQPAEGEDLVTGARGFNC